LISAVIQIPGQYRLPRDGVEKYILRESFKDLGISDRILFRQKERMSDGIGFSWVPSLINHCVSLEENQNRVDGLKRKMTTDLRMKYEKNHYEKIYKKYYQFSTILFRELPDWATSKDDNEMIIN
jgi:asparagine synthase (glutamine-hydrolysing)